MKWTKLYRKGRAEVCITFVLTLVFAFTFVLAYASIAGTSERKGATPPSPYEISESAIYERLQRLVGIASAAGGVNAGIRLNKAGFKAAEYLYREYKKAGLEDVTLEEFEPVRWWPENWELTVLGSPNRTLLSFPIWYCEGIDNAQLEVVYVGYGTPAEFQGVNVAGKAVLVDMTRIAHFIPSYSFTGAAQLALARGAKAVIVAEIYVNSPSGQTLGNAGQLHGQPTLYPLPAFSIGKSDGDYLRELVKFGPTFVRMNLHYSLTQGRAYNVVGRLPGNGAIDEIVLIGGHYDSWFSGANDNLSAQASLPEIAKYFAKQPKRARDRDIWFVSLFGHEFGNDAMGHAAFLEKHADIRQKICVFVNIDGAGTIGAEERGEDEIYYTGFDDKTGFFTTSDALRLYAEEAFLKYNNSLGMSLVPGFVVADQSTFYRSGLPTTLIIAKNIYYHSMLDTIEKTPPDVVYRFAKMNITLVEKILGSPASYLINVDRNPYRVDKPESPVLQEFRIIPREDAYVVGNPITVWMSFGYSKTETISQDRYVWNFGDGSPEVMALWTSHVYKAPGTYTITLKIIAAHGENISVSKTIMVQ